MFIKNVIVNNHYWPNLERKELIGIDLIMLVLYLISYEASVIVKKSVYVWRSYIEALLMSYPALGKLCSKFT